MPLHALHTSARVWPQPERFWPERWSAPEARGGPKGGAPTEGPGSAFLPCGAACPSSRAAEVQVCVRSRFRLYPGRVVILLALESQSRWCACGGA